MKKFKKFILLNIILFLSSCGTIKEGFVNQKKSSTDEFLVEKKSPLIMPPDYNDLPTPKKDKNKKNTSESQIKDFLLKQDNKNDNLDSVENLNKNFEESLLKKIKNN